MVQLRSVGGAVNDMDPHATAYDPDNVFDRDFSIPPAARDEADRRPEAA